MINGDKRIGESVLSMETEKKSLTISRRRVGCFFDDKQNEILLHLLRDFETGFSLHKSLIVERESC